MAVGSEKLATCAVGVTMDYNATVAALREYYYDGKQTLYYQSLFADRKTQYYHSDITQFLEQVKADRTGIKLCGYSSPTANTINIHKQYSQW